MKKVTIYLSLLIAVSVAAVAGPASNTRAAFETAAFLPIPSSHDIDFSAALGRTDTLTANTTYTFSGFNNDGRPRTFYITNTAGNYTVTWPTTVVYNSATYTVKWQGGTIPTQTTGAKTDCYTFTVVGTSVIYAQVAQNF